MPRLSAIEVPYERDRRRQWFLGKYGATNGGAFLLAFNKMIASVGEDFHTHYRFAVVGDEREESSYERIRASGCCGHSDFVSDVPIPCHATPIKVRMGLNYGH